jgi:hypothetical protein
MGATGMVRIKSSQKLFTEDEVVTLTGICLESLRGLALNKHLGKLVQAAGAEAQKLLFTSSELMILNLLYHRCQREA